MRKILFCLMVMTSFDSFAEVLTCPETITCNYEKGSCEYPNKEAWVLWADPEAYFSGDLTIQLSPHVNASKLPQIDGKDPYYLECHYGYGDAKAETGVGSMYLVAQVDKLIGDNWRFSGFGSRHATCFIATSLDECAGEKIE